MKRRVLLLGLMQRHMLWENFCLLWWFLSTADSDLTIKSHFDANHTLAALHIDSSYLLRTQGKGWKYFLHDKLEMSSVNCIERYQDTTRNHLKRKIKTSMGWQTKIEGTESHKSGFPTSKWYLLLSERQIISFKYEYILTSLIPGIIEGTLHLKNHYRIQNLPSYGE